MARERYIKDHQADFDSMIEAAELMAQDWIKQGFNPWETWGLADVRMAKDQQLTSSNSLN
ncbi:hypothetical protein BN59_03622 [Legionella massiliensis]|uniref:Uncharacterized protein n=1 Tax=Legionella massiliensis TaxID=1034943 RepID=A0A078L5D9_9GAMM|nr:hypothetical protein [Legionella massiliensis]CDZ79304.1 hypothetical protein BN59_03622 [Legionella massiliensis]CEE15042.1 hypothetical protein BN1094_03622 [Legionella massiliensis]